MKFEPMPKIPRWTRGCVITEKIDGTNASIFILKNQGPERTPPMPEIPYVATVVMGDDEFFIWAGSRTRFINPGKETDNYGFAAWVKENAQELAKLGPGHHFGEWWGSGIQRRYGLTNGERRFSLFDIRWLERENRPACASVVPVLYRGVLEGAAVENAMIILREKGSLAAPGFMQPEGVVIWHSAARQHFKKTFEKDQEGKGE